MRLVGRPRSTLKLTGLLLGIIVIGVSCADESSGTATDPQPIESEAQGQDGSERVHPDFNFTANEFDLVVSGFSSGLRANVLARPYEFLEGMSQVLDEPAHLTWLVDKTHYLPNDYRPEVLADLDRYRNRLLLNRSGHQLSAEVVQPLFVMIDAASDADLSLLISSTFRSFDRQREVYDYRVEQLGQEEADKVSARPGTSQHQLGTTIDFGCICDEFAQEPIGIWLAEHAWEYGFSLSYPDGHYQQTGYTYEPWHFRFIGVPASRLEHEFFGGVQHELLEFLAEFREEFASARVEPGI